MALSAHGLLKWDWVGGEGGWITGHDYNLGEDLWCVARKEDSYNKAVCGL